MKLNLFLVALAVAALPLGAHAQLKITEVESSEVGSLHADWWELSNFGSSSVNLTGYRFNDDTGGFASGAFTVPTVSIGAGESIIFLDANISVAAFKTWWGSTLNSSVQIITYPDSGLGLGAGGDQVNFFNTSGTLVDNATFGAATAGTSFTFNPVTGTVSSLQSQVGVNGAWASTENGDIGSPGVVPEPGSIAILGVGLAAILGIRRQRNA